MTPKRIAHVFPFDARHLSDDPIGFMRQQRQRWPLAAVGRSRLAERSSAHFVTPSSWREPGPPLELIGHRSLLSGPRWRDWGDDWSLSLGRFLRRLGPDGVCVLHLNDYAAARLAHRAAHRARVVLVFHGRGLGRAGDHLLSADRHVVLHEGAAEGLADLGVPRDRIVVMQPSIDIELFRPADRQAQELVFGFIGRVEESKGVLDLPGVLLEIPGARIEIVGPATPRQAQMLVEHASGHGVERRLSFLGELPPEHVAARLREWRVLLVPSYTEGSPLVVAEAAAARVPVAAVSGVLPAAIEAASSVHVGDRGRYAQVVADAVAAGRPPPAAWLRSHDDGASAWDELLEGLPAWGPRPRVAAPGLERARRLRPLRAAVRALRRRGSRTIGARRAA